MIFGLALFDFFEIRHFFNLQHVSVLVWKNFADPKLWKNLCFELYFSIFLSYFYFRHSEFRPSSLFHSSLSLQFPCFCHFISRHVSRSENLGGQAVRGGAKNLGGAVRTGPKYYEMKWNEMIWNEMKGNEMNWNEMAKEKI